MHKNDLNDASESDCIVYPWTLQGKRENPFLYAQLLAKFIFGEPTWRNYLSNWQKVTLSCEFLQELALKCENLSLPSAPSNITIAFLLPNYRRLAGSMSLASPRQVNKLLVIEIKPKMPVMLENNRCYSCMKQYKAGLSSAGHLNQHVSAKGASTVPLTSSCSSCCPFNLFSRDRRRLEDCLVAHQHLALARSSYPYFRIHKQELPVEERLTSILVEILVRDPILTLLRSAHDKLAESSVPLDVHLGDINYSPLMEGEQSASKLSRYLASRSIRDCSLMIQVSDKPFDNSDHISVKCISYFYRIFVIDLDEKPAIRIAAYRQIDNSLSRLSMELNELDYRFCVP